MAVKISGSPTGVSTTALAGGPPSSAISVHASAVSGSLARVGPGTAISASPTAGAASGSSGC